MNGKKSKILKSYVSVITLNGKVQSLGERIFKEIALKAGLGALSFPEYMILQGIGKKRTAIKDILSNGHYTKTNPTYTLAKMELNGHIKRRFCQTDRRKCYIQVTQEGQKAIQKMNSVLESHVEKTPLATMMNLQFLLKCFEDFWQGILRDLYPPQEASTLACEIDGAPFEKFASCPSAPNENHALQEKA